MTPAGGAILVVGGTGRIGARVCRSLAGRDDVRALARSDAAAARLAGWGVGVVRGDLDDPASLGSAFAGAGRVFLVTPFGEAQRARELHAVAAARAAGAQRIVKISTESIRVAGEDTPDPVAVVRSHLDVERELRASGVDAVSLRPTFISHLLAGQLEQIRGGEIALPFGDCAMALVHPADVADVAVACLTAPDVVEGPRHLTGPEALTFDQVARRVSVAVGHEVAYRPLDNAAWREGAVAAGLPADFAAGLAEGFRLYAERPRAEVTDDVSRILGRPARGLDEYLRDELVPALRAA